MNYLKYKIIGGALPFALKKRIIKLRTYTSRLPYVIAYRGIQTTGAIRHKQVEYLPSLVNPQVFWVEHEKIVFQGLIGNKKGRLSLGGSWDIDNIYSYTTIFEEVPKTARCWDIHETIRTIFLFGNAYQESPQFKSMMQCVAEKRLSKHFKLLHSIEDIHNYFARLTAAYKSMKKYGFLTQKEQGKLNEWEIEIFVTREGKLCIGRGGNHRIRMAELFGFEHVPVIIKGIHPIWIEKLTKQYSLPPHKAVQKWLTNEFSTEKPMNKNNAKQYELRD